MRIDKALVYMSHPCLADINFLSYTELGTNIYTLASRQRIHRRLALYGKDHLLVLLLGRSGLGDKVD